MKIGVIYTISAESTSFFIPICVDFDMVFSMNLLLPGDFFRQRHDDAPGELGIVSGLGPLHAVPKRVPVGQFRWRVGRREDGREYHLLLVAIMLGLLIVLAEEALAALVGGSGYGGLATTSLYDLDVEMGTGQTVSPPD